MAGLSMVKVALAIGTCRFSGSVRDILLDTAIAPGAAALPNSEKPVSPSRHTAVTPFPKERAPRLTGLLIEGIMKLMDWAAKAAPGERIAYHVGDLCFDAEPEAARLLKRIRADAWQLMVDGVVELVRRKLEPFRFEYIAIKRARHRPMGFCGCYDPEYLTSEVLDKN